MDRVESLENEIRHLSPEELAAFREWFISFDGESWDREIEFDAKAGKLDALSAKALKDHRDKRSQEL